VSSHSGILLFGGKAMAVEVTIQGAMPVTQALKSLEEMSETRFTYVPHGEVSCAGFAKLEDRKFFLMYFPPKMRPLSWKNKHTGEQKIFSVRWPHTYVGVFFRGGAIEDGYAMFSKKKLTQPSDKVGRMPMPNLSKKFGHICEGAKGMWNIMARPEDTIMGYSEYFLKSEWISDINDHWGYVPKQLWVPGWDFTKPIQGEMHIEELNQKMLGIWESLSDVDPKAADNMDWKETFTIQDLIQHEWNGKMGLDGSPLTQEQIASILTPAAAAAGPLQIHAQVQ
jgi:hypothetical protein